MRNCQNKRKTKGFTFMEVLMVVTIIGLLVSIARPAINDARERTQAVNRNNIVRAVETAKMRALLAGDVNASDWATYAKFKKYLTIGGVTAPPIQMITRKATNGAGAGIAYWGTYAPAIDKWGSESGAITYQPMDFGGTYSRTGWFTSEASGIYGILLETSWASGLEPVSPE